MQNFNNAMWRENNIYMSFHFSATWKIFTILLKRSFFPWLILFLSKTAFLKLQTAYVSPGTLLKWRTGFSRSAVRPVVCISSKLIGDSNASGPWAILGAAKLLRDFLSQTCSENNWLKAFFWRYHCRIESQMCYYMVIPHRINRQMCRIKCDIVRK